MKDYRLSEIKAICKHRNAKFARPCDDCECVEFCGIIDAYNGMPIDIVDRLNIEPRDMIELPYKQEIKFSEERSEWQVVWRDDFIQRIRFADFPTEPEADVFLAELKGGKA